MERVKLILQLQRILPTALAGRFLELGAQPRGNIGRDGNTANTAHCIEAKGHVVVAAELHKLFAACLTLGGYAGKIASRILHPDHIRQPRQPSHRIDGNVRDSARRHIVQDNRNIEIGHRREVRIDAVLIRAVIIRRHVKSGVRAGVLGSLGQLDRMGSIVGAAAGNDRYPATRHFHRDLDQAAMLVA